MGPGSVSVADVDVTLHGQSEGQPEKQTYSIYQPRQDSAAFIVLCWPILQKSFIMINKLEKSSAANFGLFQPFLAFSTIITQRHQPIEYSADFVAGLFYKDIRDDS